MKFNTNSQIPNLGSIFGKVLQRYRSKLNLSQEELAFRAGVDRTFVSRIERGIRQPTITTLVGLGLALGVSAAELAQETEAEYFRQEKKKKLK